MLFGLILASAVVIYFFIWPKLKESQTNKKLARWNNTPKDVVILHAVKRGATISHPSPFVVKLETFLRMAKIPYETDFGLSDAWGPKGRFPWISLNGQHIGDSQFIIEFLKKKFDVQLGAKYTKQEKSLGAIIRIMMDDHFFWTIPLSRFVWGRFSSLKSMMGPKALAWKVCLFKLYAGRAFLSRSKGHGIGLHTREEIEGLMVKDLEYLSDFLGDKKFILGNEPSEYDCTVFGHLAEAMWGLPDSKFEKLLKGENFPTLKAYCERIRDTYYPDWDKLLEK